MIDRILDLLKERGITQKQLAEAIHVSTGNVSDWKSGKAKPSVDVTVRIAEFLNVSVDYLVGRSDMQNTDELIALYNIGVMRWINDRAFKPEEKAILKDHFFELILRYKTAINKLANSMYSDTRKMMVAANASCEEMSLATCEAIRPFLRDMINWIAMLPYEFSKRAPSLSNDHTQLISSLSKMLDLAPESSSMGKSSIDDDERDLLEIWGLLDKDGKRVLMGEAVKQKQRAFTQEKNEQP